MNICKNLKKCGWYILIISIMAVSGCRQGSEITPTPPDSIYNIMVYAKSIEEGFPDMQGASVIVGGQEVAPGTPVIYNATDYGSDVKLNMKGGHSAVLCVRAPDGTYNLAQSQNGQPVFINLPTLDADARVGSDVNLVLYKIPSTIPIKAVKEALRDGTAVYDHPVTFGVENEGYTEEEFKKAKIIAYSKIVNALNQINNIPGVPGCNYDPNQEGGKQKIRLSPEYVNAGHTESGSGVMTWSEIKISHVLPDDVFLAELYQTMGVRSDIGTDGSIRDDISGNTATLNQFGINLMLINYFLEPNTKP